MLNMKKTLTKILDALKVDYIVEQGTSGIWTYRKWHSGISECWGTASESTSFAVWVAPIYYGTTSIGSFAFPSGLFSDVPVIEVSLRASGADIWTGVDSSSVLSASWTGKYYPLRVNSGPTVTYYARFYAIGKWK